MAGRYIRINERARTWRYATRDQVAQELAGQYSDIATCLGMLDQGLPLPIPGVTFHLEGRLDFANDLKPERDRGQRLYI